MHQTRSSLQTSSSQMICKGKCAKPASASNTKQSEPDTLQQQQQQQQSNRLVAAAAAVWTWHTQACLCSVSAWKQLTGSSRPTPAFCCKAELKWYNACIKACRSTAVQATPHTPTPHPQGGRGGRPGCWNIYIYYCTYMYHIYIYIYITFIYHSNALASI